MGATDSPCGDPEGFSTLAVVRKIKNAPPPVRVTDDEAIEGAKIWLRTKDAVKSIIRVTKPYVCHFWCHTF